MRIKKVMETVGQRSVSVDMAMLKDEVGRLGKKLDQRNIQIITMSEKIKEYEQYIMKLEESAKPRPQYTD